MKNTRRQKRYKVDSTNIRGTIILANYLKINDISIGGISLTTEKRLTIGNEYALKLQGKDTQLTLKGIVMWSLLSESIADSIGNVIPIFKTGIQFMELSTEQENEIIKFIEAHKKEPEEKIDIYSVSGNRLFVRFRLKEADKATLQEQDDYKVKNISLSGLLIESKQALKLEDKIDMQMALPDNKIISILGRVVTCTMTKPVESESYDIGMEFIDISEKDEKALKNFISLLS
ncbi:MAG: PilZ domain-containing protein [Nitrospira sp.]|nr:PilZ domain-containing protein [Nitrospira sp.]